MLCCVWLRAAAFPLTADVVGQNELAAQNHRQPGSKCFGAKSGLHNSILTHLICGVQHYVQSFHSTLSRPLSPDISVSEPEILSTVSASFFGPKKIPSSFFFLLLSASAHPSCSLLPEIIPASSPLSSIFMQMAVEGVTVLNANKLRALPNQATM